MTRNKRRRVDPPLRVISIPGPDKGSRKFAHLEMKMRPVFSVRRSDGRDLFATPDVLLRLHQDRLAVAIKRLHVFAFPVFPEGVEDDNDVAPTLSAFFRQENASIGDCVDRIAAIAVLTPDAIEIVAEVAILAEVLGVVGESAVLASDRKIEPACFRQRGEERGRRQLKGRRDSPGLAEIGREAKDQTGGEGGNKRHEQQQPPRPSSPRSSLARVWLHLYARAMRILVTGGAGFIGSHLVEKLLATGHEVSILDDFNDFYDPAIKRANVEAFASDVPIHRLDLRDGASVSQLFDREKFDAIVHLAARAGVRPSIQQPQLYYDTNVSGTLHLLEAARRRGIERFVFGSSSSVYGVSKTVPFSESLPLNQTISPYAATKIAGEFLCSTYSHLYQMRVVALRFFTVYGARQRPDLAIHQFTRRIHAGQPIDQFGDGSTRRDYTYIDDIMQGVMAALRYDGPLFDIFNLGENDTIQLKDLIAAIEKALGRKAKINQLPEQPGDMPVTCADITKAKQLLGYNPTTPLSAGLPKFVDWFLSCSRDR
jgi:UDP-glucuronate 4-epimerase